MRVILTYFHLNYTPMGDCPLLRNDLHMGQYWLFIMFALRHNLVMRTCNYHVKLVKDWYQPTRAQHKNVFRDSGSPFYYGVKSKVLVLVRRSMSREIEVGMIGIGRGNLCLRLEQDYKMPGIKLGRWERNATTGSPCSINDLHRIATEIFLYSYPHTHTHVYIDNYTRAKVSRPSFRRNINCRLAVCLR